MHGMVHNYHVHACLQDNAIVSNDDEEKVKLMFIKL